MDSCSTHLILSHVTNCIQGWITKQMPLYTRFTVCQMVCAAFIESLLLKTKAQYQLT